MLSFFTQATLALLLSGPTLAQNKPAPNTFASEVPQSESVALAKIVEDDPASVPAQRKGGDSSPAYTLYSQQLPIPPIAEVKQ